MLRPSTAEFGSLGSTIVPVPFTRDQVPTAGKMIALPCRFVLMVVPVGVHSS